MKYGILNLPRLRRKPRALMTALINSVRVSGDDYTVFETYQPCDVLVLYGWGGPKQQQAIKAHKGKYVALDLGYWGRDGLNTRNWRVSINGFHCPDLIMRGDLPPADRVAGVSVKNIPHRKNGPILLIGNAPKSARVIEPGWSQHKAKEIRKHFPGCQIVYRPKPRRPIERGVSYDRVSMGEIDDAISRASLVVCRHSNVAVDCCLVGVPVVCEDGAGSAIYPHELKDYQNQPDFQTRVDFIRRLSYWQWTINDISAGRFWPWLNATLAQ